MTNAIKGAIVVTATMLSSCDPPNMERGTPPSKEWEKIGEHLYRLVDQENRVACYRSYTSTPPMSCVKLEAP